MLLSDAFEHPVSCPALELKALVLNINTGYNEKLMKKCRILYEYTVFVSKVREYSGYLPFGQAVEKAMNDCIADGILREFLLKNRAEVMSMSIFEYNEELHIQQERDDAMEEGVQRGIWQDKIHLIKKNRSKGRSPEEISDILEAELSFVHEIIDLINGYPDAGSSELCTLWVSRKK